MPRIGLALEYASKTDTREQSIAIKVHDSRYLDIIT